MHTKNHGRPLPALPLSADVAGETKAPAKGLSAALDAALGAGAGKPQFPGQKASPRREDAIDKAPKPTGGANRTMSPRRGHR